MKDKNHMIQLIQKRRNIWEKSPFFQQLEHKEMYLNIIMTICDKPTANIIQSGERLKAFPPNQGKGAHSTQYVSLSQSNQVTQNK